MSENNKSIDGHGSRPSEPPEVGIHILAMLQELINLSQSSQSPKVKLELQLRVWCSLRRVVCRVMDILICIKGRPFPESGLIQDRLGNTLKTLLILEDRLIIEVISTSSQPQQGSSRNGVNQLSNQGDMNRQTLETEDLSRFGAHAIDRSTHRVESESGDLELNGLSPLLLHRYLRETELTVEQYEARVINHVGLIEFRNLVVSNRIRRLQPGVVEFLWNALVDNILSTLPGLVSCEDFLVDRRAVLTTMIECTNTRRPLSGPQMELEQLRDELALVDSAQRVVKHLKSQAIETEREQLRASWESTTFGYESRRPERNYHATDLYPPSGRVPGGSPLSGLGMKRNNDSHPEGEDRKTWADFERNSHELPGSYPQHPYSRGGLHLPTDFMERLNLNSVIDNCNSNSNLQNSPGDFPPSFRPVPGPQNLAHRYDFLSGRDARSFSRPFEPLEEHPFPQMGSFYGGNYNNTSDRREREWFDGPFVPDSRFPLNQRGIHNPPLQYQFPQRSGMYYVPFLVDGNGGLPQWAGIPGINSSSSNRPPRGNPPSPQPSATTSVQEGPENMTGSAANLRAALNGLERDRADGLENVNTTGASGRVLRERLENRTRQMEVNISQLLQATTRTENALKEHSDRIRSMENTLITFLEGFRGIREELKLLRMLRYFGSNRGINEDRDGRDSVNENLGHRLGDAHLQNGDGVGPSRRSDDLYTASEEINMNISPRVQMNNYGFPIDNTEISNLHEPSYDTNDYNELNGAAGGNPLSSTLNNQVPPGTRANNYWDNFKSYSQQNLLSSSKANIPTNELSPSGSEGRGFSNEESDIISNNLPSNSSRRQSRQDLNNGPGTVIKKGSLSSNFVENIGFKKRNHEAKQQQLPSTSRSSSSTSMASQNENVSPVYNAPNPVANSVPGSEFVPSLLSAFAYRERPSINITRNRVENHENTETIRSDSDGSERATPVQHDLTPLTNGVISNGLTSSPPSALEVSFGRIGTDNNQGASDAPNGDSTLVGLDLNSGIPKKSRTSGNCSKARTTDEGSNATPDLVCVSVPNGEGGGSELLVDLDGWNEDGGGDDNVKES